MSSITIYCLKMFNNNVRLNDRYIFNSGTPMDKCVLKVESSPGEKNITIFV